MYGNLTCATLAIMSQFYQATVVYLGHLPYGFYETQIKGFLSQFGDVGRLRVSRSPKVSSSL